jgi:hypothetical protein
MSHATSFAKNLARVRQKPGLRIATRRELLLGLDLESRLRLLSNQS